MSTKNVSDMHANENSAVMKAAVITPVEETTKGVIPVSAPVAGPIAGLTRKSRRGFGRAKKRIVLSKG